MSKEVPEDIQILLKQVCDFFDKEDRATRERQIRIWRRLKLTWDGVQRVWYSEVAHDWRVYDAQAAVDNNDQSYYDKPINVFRAYLESIIAALSITIPPVKCYPDDADNPLDLATAKAGDKIGELIYRHNNAPLLWLHALFIYVTEGMMACYSYPKEDEAYGTYKVDKTEDSTEEAYVCPVCQTRLADELFSNRERDEFMPDNQDVTLHDALRQENICPQCGSMLDPDLQKSSFIVTKIVGETTKVKSRICTEVYGGLYVKIPNYAIKQSDCPYLIFSYETHYTNALEKYPNLRDKLHAGTGMSGSGIYDPYERWARLNPQYNGEFPRDTVTVRNNWLRPSAFNTLPEDDAKKLKKLYPDGAKVIIINDCFADAENESLDDCWTLSLNPMSDYIHHDPLGRLLESVQDITDSIVSLVLQTIEHGIPQTFADPEVLNFNQYQQTEVLPGGIFPARPRSGKSIGEAFHEVKTATLSGEVLPFFTEIQNLGQLVSGALPSLFGGAIEGSRTASQYSMSRAQALQRLQNVWKMLTIWWKTIYSKAIPMYIKELHEDEKNVEIDEQGNFVNVFIRMAELEGKIGKIELESNENLPITWAQQKDIVMQLLENQNPKIQEAISSPENSQYISDAIGLTDFIVPGEDDRQKQYEEIRQLINSEPITQPPDPMQAQQALAMGQMPQDVELPSVEVDPMIDNHDIEADICRRYLVSAAGRLLKTENPMGYKNVLLHMKAHMEQIQQSMMGAMDQQQSGASPEKPKGTSMPLAQGAEVATTQ